MDKIKPISHEVGTPLFNTPAETGLRSLVMLVALKPSSCDLQRLIYFDYLLVNSGDVPEGPPSLHPSLPHRSGALLVRRQLVATGLALLQSKELVKKNFDSTGISFMASELADPFLGYFSSQYFKELRERAEWLSKKFAKSSDKEFAAFIRNNIDKWGSEFSRETVAQEMFE